MGVFARDGVNLLVNELNDQGGINGRKLKLFIEDNQGDPAINKKVIRKLINNEVRLILGPLTSSMAKSTLEALDGENAIVISPTISLDKIKDLDDNFIRIMSIASQQGMEISDLALNLDMTKASVVIDFPNKAYTKPVYDAFKLNYEKAGGKVQSIHKINQTPKTNFFKLAQDINQQNSDMLLIITSGIDAAVISQQVRKQNQGIQLIGAMWAKTKDVIVHGGKALEGAIFVGKYETASGTPTKALFDKEFQTQYKSKPSFISALAYEAASVLFRAIKEANTDDAMKVKQKILNIKRFDGLEEDIVINQYGDTIRKNSLFMVKNGKFELITK